MSRVGREARRHEELSFGYLLAVSVIITSRRSKPKANPGEISCTSPDREKVAEQTFIRKKYLSLLTKVVGFIQVKINEKCKAVSPWTFYLTCFILFSVYL